MIGSFSHGPSSKFVITAEQDCDPLNILWAVAYRQHIWREAFLVDKHDQVKDILWAASACFGLSH